MTKDEIRAIFMAYCFTVKEGQTDLKPYVFEAAEALLAAHSAGAQRQSTTLGEQIKQAEKEVANWTPERRANVRLQGSDLYAQPQPTTDNVLKVLTDLRRGSENMTDNPTELCEFRGTEFYSCGANICADAIRALAVKEEG